MKELEWLIKWIEDYENDYFGVTPHSNLIKNIIKSRVLEIKEDSSEKITISIKEYELLIRDSDTLWNKVDQ